jgi:cytidyltransferase-like protein
MSDEFEAGATAPAESTEEWNRGQHKKDWRVGYVSGAFDMFRVDHLDQLRAARERCNVLVVGVHTDEVVFAQTGKTPVIPFEERLEVVRWMRDVDVVVAQDTEFLAEAWARTRFDVAFVPHAIDAGHTDYQALDALGVAIIPLPGGRISATLSAATR